MAYTRGRCVNYDYCSLASQRRDIQVRLGDNFVCPECAATLTAPPIKQGGTLSRVGIAAGLACLLVAAGGLGVYAFIGSLGRPSAEGPAAASGMAAARPRQLAAAGPVASAAVKRAVPAIPPPALRPAETVVLRLRGSNTIGAVLAPKLAQAFLADTGDTDVTVAPQTAADETEVVGLRNGAREAVIISAHGSATAFTGLAAGDTEIGMASRRIKPAEHDSLGRLGDMTSPASEHVLALDGIAVIVNPASSVTDLSRAQLRDIFSGAVTDWSQLGAAPGPIHVLARDDKSGTYDTFKSLVMDRTRLSPTAKRLEDSRDLSTDVSTDPAAIGFVGLPYVADAKPVAIAELGAEPLLPNRLTVATEDYPLSRRLFLYTPTVAPSQVAQRFVAYALSPAGQAIVEQVGFIPLTIKTEPVKVPDTASAHYRALVGQAQRLSTNFRFQPNSTNLDNRGLRDLDRLVNFVVSMHTQGDHITLVGFADNQGAAATNLAVSKKRADAVSTLLLRRGVRVGHVAAFGSDLPVADNASDDGREKNRRVEVFLNP